MATTTSVQSIVRNDADTVPVAAGSAVTQGDVALVGDGRVGTVTGLNALSSSDPYALHVKRQVDILKNATSDTYAVGAPVFWDDTNNVAKTAWVAGCVYAGRCVKASASGDVYVYTDLNVQVAPRVPVAAVTAAGSAQGDAAALVEGFNVVTGADGTKGVILPTAAAGMIVYTKGVTAAVLKVYPATGGTINALSANGAISLTTGVMPSIFIASSATQWYTIPLVAS